MFVFIVVPLLEWLLELLELLLLLALLLIIILLLKLLLYEDPTQKLVLNALLDSLFVINKSKKFYKLSIVIRLFLWFSKIKTYSATSGLKRKIYETS